KGNREKPSSHPAPAHVQSLVTDVQRERGREDVTADPTLQEQPPRSRNGHEHSDVQLTRLGRAAGDPAPAEHAGAAHRPWTADVRVEVIERPGAEEDRVGERAVPGREACRLATRVVDGEVEERALDC